MIRQSHSVSWLGCSPGAIRTNAEPHQAGAFQVWSASQVKMVPDKTSLSELECVVPQAESGVRARVLLAEDDRALRRFLQIVLERAGYKVIPASDGLEAMKLALATQIDIVVTDATMPNLSGHEFCRFLRNSQTLSRLPVILLSALERKDANADQVDVFLAKPVSGERLIECIEELLARKSEAGQ